MGAKAELERDLLRPNAAAAGPWGNDRKKQCRANLNDLISPSTADLSWQQSCTETDTDVILIFP
jgi:hypothetical protein